MKKVDLLAAGEVCKAIWSTPGLKPVLNTISGCLHEASRSFGVHCEHLLLDQKHFVNTSKHRRIGLAKQCPGKTSMLLIASNWLVWTSARCWPHGTERATKWLWSWPCHTAVHRFYLALPFLSFDVGRECKINWEVHSWLWDPTNSKYTNRPRWSGKMHIIGKLFDWPRSLCCFCRSGCVFL